MDYAQQQRQPTKHLVGFGIVVALHVLLGWALVNGLARKMVEVIKGPIETKIIEEIKPPPPPPENLPPPPKLPPPPPSFVPPPEVQIANPAPAPSITVTRVAPPPTPVTIAPAPPPAPAPVAPPAPVAAPPAPKQQAVPPQINVSSCEKPEFPAAALRAEATGTSKVRFTIDATGAVAKAEIERSAGSSREHRLLDRAAIDALSKCRFKPGLDEQGKAVGGAVTIVEYVWKTE